MTLSEKQFIFAGNVAKLIEYVFARGLYCTLGEAFRTKEQAAIYAKQGKGIADSLHCKRLAIDINLFSHDGAYLTDSAAYQFLGIYWTNLHKDNRWGGSFPKPDGNHFEMKDS